MTTSEAPVGDLNKPTKKFNPGRLTRRALLGAALVTAGGILVDQISKIGFNPAQDIQNEINKRAGEAAIQANKNSGYYDMAPPPGRQAESLSSIPQNVASKDIPTIPETDNSLGIFSGYPQFSSGIGFDGYIQGETLINSSEKTNPQALITGYLVAIEKQSDDSVLFAVELPYLNSPRDILKRDVQASTPQLKIQDKSKEDIIGGTIVWLKLFKGTDPTHYPFTTIVTWGDKSFQTAGIDPNQPKTGSGDKGLREYARIGDPIRARVTLGVNLNSQNSENSAINKGLNNYYTRYHYSNSIDEAKNQLQETIDQNMQSADKLIKDANRVIPIKDQVEGKKYVFTPDFVVFLPTK